MSSPRITDDVNERVHHFMWTPFHTHAATIIVSRANSEHKPGPTCSGSVPCPYVSLTHRATPRSINHQQLEGGFAKL
jgi:hypothetical protein